MNPNARIALGPATQLAQWLALNEPALFSALQREAATQSATLNGITDFLSSIGTSIGDAVSNVGSYLASSEGVKTLTSLGTTYLGYKQQSNVLKTQVQLAMAGQAPAPIMNTVGANGQIVPVYTPTNQVASNPLLARLQPSFLDQYKMPLLIGGGILALVLLTSAVRS